MSDNRSALRPLACAALLALGLAGTASADGDLYLGVLAHDVPALWSHHDRESGVDLNLEWAPAWPDRQVRPLRVGSHLGVNLNSAGDTSFLYGGLHLRFGERRGWFGRLGLGGALHNGERELVSSDRKALGSRLLFHIPIELGYQWQRHSLSLYFSHVSNAYLADPNEGLDTLGLRMGWRY